MMYEDVKGKKVLVTGSSSGIGAATAVMFAQQGCFVGVHYFATKQGGEKTLENILIRDIQRVPLDTSAMELFPLLTDNEYPIAVVNEANRLQGVIIKGLLLGALADSTQVNGKT